MGKLKMFLVLCIMLKSQFSNQLDVDGFLQEEHWHAKRYSLSSILLQGVSHTCNSSFRSLETDKILQYFDCWGKPGSGILSGNVKWLGAFDQCLQISESKYCLVTVLGKFRTNKTLPIWYGICVPDACDERDVANAAANFINNVSRRYFPTVRVIDLSCYEEQSYTTGVVLTIILCGIILACCVIGTTIQVCQESFKNGEEYVHLPDENGIVKQDTGQDESSFSQEISKVTETTPLIRPNKKQNGISVTDSLKLKTENEKNIFDNLVLKEKIEAKPSLKPNGKVVEFFLCFSLIRNSRNVFKTDVAPGAVTSLFGMRVVSMFWVALGHVYLFTRYPTLIVENARDMLKESENFSMMVITNAFPSVDTFFFLSGLLLMYNVMKRLQNNNGEIHWGKFYLHRFIRLTPTMMFVILFIVQLEPFVDKGPYWRQHVGYNNCDDYWWTNLLYINNFYPTNVAAESCLQWGWYLAVDMQFFIIAPFIIYLFYKYGYRGVIGTSLSLGTASIICTAIITKHYNLHPMDMSNPKSPISALSDTFNYVYVKPYCRIHPYLIGLVFGYLMHRRFFKVKQLNWPLAIIFWCAAVATAFSVIYGPFTALREDPRPWTMTEKILYTTTRNLAWGICVAWVTYACEYGYGGYVKEFLSARFWIPLGRLTYSTYLVHAQLVNVMYNGYRSGLHFTTHWWAYIFCAVLVLSYGIGFIVVVTIEYPCANLEKLLFRRNERKDQK